MRTKSGFLNTPYGFLRLGVLLVIVTPSMGTGDSPLVSVLEWMGNLSVSLVSAALERLGTGEAASLIEDLRLLFLVEVLRWLDIEKL